MTYYEKHHKPELYLNCEKDSGPFYAFTYMAQAAKAIYNLEMPSNCKYNQQQWQLILNTKVKFGLVKDTPDCGTSSVSMGAAVEHFTKFPPKNAMMKEVVLFLNCGSGGIKYQLYESFNGMIRCVEEEKGFGSNELPNPNAIKIGNYIPSMLRDFNEDQQKLSKTLKSMCAKISIDFKCYAFVTGKLRENYEKSNDEEKKLKNIDIQKYFSNHEIECLGDSFFMTQEQESKLEFLGTSVLYENLFKKNYLSQSLKVDQSWGIGLGSCQFGDFILYPYGMNDLRNLSNLPLEVTKKLSNIALIEKLMDRWMNEPRLSIIALKSGCALLPDKYTDIREKLHDLKNYQEEKVKKLLQECQQNNEKRKELYTQVGKLYLEIDDSTLEFLLGECDNLLSDN